MWTLTSAGSGHHRHLRRDAVHRGQPATRSTSTRAAAATMTRSTPALKAPEEPTSQVTFNRDGARPGDRLRDRRRPARTRISRKRSIRAPRVDQLLYPGLTRGGALRAGPSSRRQPSRRRRSTRSTSTTSDRDVHVRAAPDPPAGLDSGLPTDGRGSTSGAASSRREDTRRRSPETGVLNNWNNKPARGFPARTTSGPTARSGASTCSTRTRPSASGTRSRRSGRDERRRDPGRARDDVRAAAGASSCAAVPRRSPRAARMLELLEDWRARGQPARPRPRRQDRPPGAAVLDTAWPRLADAAMAPVLGPGRSPTSSDDTLHRASTCRPAASSAAGTCTCRRTCAG